MPQIWTIYFVCIAYSAEQMYVNSQTNFVNQVKFLYKTQQKWQGKKTATFVITWKTVEKPITYLFEKMFQCLKMCNIKNSHWIVQK